MCVGGGGGGKLVLRAQPQPQFLEWYNTVTCTPDFGIEGRTLVPIVSALGHCLISNLYVSSC